MQKSIISLLLALLLLLVLVSVSTLVIVVEGGASTRRATNRSGGGSGSVRSSTTTTVIRNQNDNNEQQQEEEEEVIIHNEDAITMANDDDDIKTQADGVVETTARKAPPLPPPPEPKPPVDPKQETTWDTLDARPLPAWYDQAKFGIFIHWGVFSVPSFGTEWFLQQWKIAKSSEFINFINKMERPGFNYAEYASRFTAEFYRPMEWAKIFALSGAQYVILTSKHHEGYCNWNSTSIPTTYNWNSVEIGSYRDLLGELTTAVRSMQSPQTNRTLRMGFYHSLFEWLNPMYISDKKTNFTKQDFVNLKTIPELYDLVERYEPEYIWSDGQWEAHSDYWNAIEFLDWYSTKSNVADTGIWNDRWGIDTICRHGAVYTCNDSYNPGVLQTHKWEDATTIDKTSWGYNRNATYVDYHTTKELIDMLVSVIAMNGNLLLNIGPASDGTINPIFIDRLLGIGEWLTVNGDAVYDTRPWDICQNETDSNVYYTRTETILYVHFLQWPTDSILSIECPITTENTIVTFLGLKEAEEQKDDDDDEEYYEGSNSVDGIYDTDENNNYNTKSGDLVWWKGQAEEDYGAVDDDDDDEGGITVELPLLTPDRIPCQHAWVLAMTNIQNLGPLVPLSSRPPSATSTMTRTKQE